MNADPQWDMTKGLGFIREKRPEVTIAQMMRKSLDGESFRLGEGIVHNDEGVDLVPGSIEMPGSEKLAKVEAAFDVFKAENVKRKNEVKNGAVLESKYTDWLSEQRDIIDNLMDS